MWAGPWLLLVLLAHNALPMSSTWVVEDKSLAHWRQGVGQLGQLGCVCEPCLHCCVVDHVENRGRLIESKRCTTVCVDLAVAIAGVDDEVELVKWPCVWILLARQTSRYRWILEGNSKHSETCPYLTRQSFGHFYLVKVPFRPEKVSTFSGVDR